MSSLLKKRAKTGTDKDDAPPPSSATEAVPVLVASTSTEEGPTDKSLEQIDKSCPLEWNGSDAEIGYGEDEANLCLSVGWENHDPGEEKIIENCLAWNMSIQRKGNIILTVNRKMLTPKRLKRPCEWTVRLIKMFFSLPQMVEALAIYFWSDIFGKTPFSTDSDEERDNDNDGEKEKTSLSNHNESLLAIPF